MQRRFTPTISGSYAAGPRTLPFEPVIYAKPLYGPANLVAADAGQGRPADLDGKDLTGKIAVVTRSSTLIVRDQVANVATAGAKAVIVVNDRPGPYATIVPRVTGTTIPAWSLTQDSGQALLARIAEGETLLNLKGITNHPSVYNISLVAPGEHPRRPHRRGHAPPTPPSWKPTTEPPPRARSWAIGTPPCAPATPPSSRSRTTSRARRTAPSGTPPAAGGRCWSRCGGCTPSTPTAAPTTPSAT